jgi:hypothetical protein
MTLKKQLFAPVHMLPGDLFFLEGEAACADGRAALAWRASIQTAGRPASVSRACSHAASEHASSPTRSITISHALKKAMSAPARSPHAPHAQCNRYRRRRRLRSLPTTRPIRQSNPRLLLLDACGRSTHRTTFTHPERSSHRVYRGKTPITPSVRQVIRVLVARLSRS